MIYLDHNATTPVDPRALEAMLPYLQTHYGNPSSGHPLGVAAREGVERARQQLADLLGCSTEELVFTSGGSESNNHAIKGAARALRERGDQIITSAVEHPAVTEVCRDLEREGFDVVTLTVDGQGLVDPAAVEDAISSRTVLVSVMHSNNEVGTLQPIHEICAVAHRHGVLVHSDCAQSLGKVLVEVDELGVDLLSVAGHKLYAPKGVGALYVRAGTTLQKLIHGADHEHDRRAGTENVASIVGLGQACALVQARLEKDAEHMRRMRDRLERGLRQRLDRLVINGHPLERLPNTASLAFEGLEAGAILGALPDIAASAGAACHGSGVQVSTVLAAMAVPLPLARGTVRFSVGRYTTAEQIDLAIQQISAAVSSLRQDPSANPR